MSYFIEKQGAIEHEYFQAGPGIKIYLGRKDKPESAKTENVFKALDYLDQKNVKHSELYDFLLSKLPTEERDQYLSKQIEELHQKENRYISSLSDPDLKRQYSGDRTKVRQKGIAKIKIAEKVTTPILNKINQYVIQHGGLNLKEKKNFEELLKEIEKDLKK
ncbi:MAG: hypothetical protein IIA83_02975 [Thaumarchaeota archaeon]|nr:hypothetical protein [Nitrososphaerota archaeon]